MPNVKHTSRFKRDYKREKLGRHSKRLDAELMAAVTVLAQAEPLPRRYFGDPGVVVTKVVHRQKGF